MRIAILSALAISVLSAWSIDPNCLIKSSNQCQKCRKEFSLVDKICVEDSKRSTKTIPTPVPVPGPTTNPTTIPINLIPPKIDNSKKQPVDPQDPCPGKDFCGEAQIFQNDQDFNTFVQQYPNPNQGGQAQLDSVAVKANSGQQVSLSVAGGSAAGGSGAAKQTSFASQNANSNSGQSNSIQSNTNSDANPTDFSGTNNQVKNVDEADIIKTDGNYIYSISRKTLSIVKAYPYLDAGVVSTINFESSPQNLFIQGNYLVCFGTHYTQTYINQPYYDQPIAVTNNLKASSNVRIARPIYQTIQSSQLFVKVYDISDRTNPNLIKDYSFQGRYFNGRKQDGYVYILSQFGLYQRGYDLPYYIFNGRRQTVNTRRIFWYPGKYYSPNFVSVFALDLANPQSSDVNIATIVSQSAHNLYMSEKNIYITHTDYQFNSQSTVIHKIYVKKTKIIPYADGKVDGTIVNQFSLDEYKGVLRIATTTSSNKVKNNIFCLNRYLTKIGSLTNLAESQRIYSTRFVNQKLYIVTFRQIDPFFVVDLSNSYQPKVLGQLKIPGFSRYLHPYDQNTIIGLGRQATTNGQQLGLKISLFDVSNVYSPTQIASYQLQERYASSSAQYQHKAFLFSKQKGILVIPGSYYNYQKQSQSFNGAFVFNIGPSSIALKGIVDHDFGDLSNFYQKGVQRSIYIQNILYTKSLCLLRINDLQSLYGYKNVDLPCQEASNNYPYNGYPIF